MYKKNNVFWGSRMRIFWIFYDLWWRREHHFHYFLKKSSDFMENDGTSILWDPTMFASYFQGCDPSGKHHKAKSKAFGNKCYFSYERNRPKSDFPRFYVQFYDNFWEHFSSMIQVSFSSTRKCKKIKSQVLARRGYPRHITEEGGTTWGFPP